MSNSDSAAECVKQLSPFWKSRGLTNSEVHTIGHFLLANGEIQGLLQFCLESIDRDEYVCWDHFTKALQLLIPDLTHPLYEHLKNYVQDQRKLDDFLFSPLFHTLFPTESDIKFQNLQQKIKGKERMKQSLFEQVKIHRQNKNPELEKKSLEKFLKHFPKDDEGLQRLKEMETEELQSFFIKYRTLYPSRTFLDFEEFSLEERQSLHEIYEQFVKKIEKTKGIGQKDLISFSYFFIFLNDYEHAIALVQLLSPGPTKDWLHLELLLRHNKFAECLSLINEMEPQHKKNPDYYATKVYFVAQCFWGLGEAEKAIELMENLIHVKPDYRLSSSLLKRWKEDL